MIINSINDFNRVIIPQDPLREREIYPFIFFMYIGMHTAYIGAITQMDADIFKARLQTFILIGIFLFHSNRRL